MESSRPDTDDVLVRIRSALPALRPAERRVASAVLSDPAEVAALSISEVARRCRTSETTISRLVRSLDYPGYPTFRLAVARAATLEQAGLAPGEKVQSSDISEDDSLTAIIAKVAYADARAIEDTVRHLAEEQLELAIAALQSARRIDVFGIGASGFVASDFAQKLRRIGKTAFDWLDVDSAVTASALSGPSDVFVAISHSGESRDVLAAATCASEAGASTLAITSNAASSIARACDITLVAMARETTFRSGAMSSRIAQLALVDIIFVALASRSFASSMRALEVTRAAIDGLRR